MHHLNHLRIGKANDDLRFLEMRILHNVGDIVDRGDGNIAGLEEGDGLLLGHRADKIGSPAQNRYLPLGARGGRVVVRILMEMRLSRRLENPLWQRVHGSREGQTLANLRAEEAAGDSVLGRVTVTG